ncbi:-Protein C20orf11 homolog [Babesia bigemina]|uniref:-Protein C20orf11 homolog n=1 Tax=Babesia bigemina TaxID=5866 RepID=A0A061DER4_BABBI|nr:-Protein C20orf11 homolog [Babesia bigemina]CDR97735.1 -Protein C20orf11 homolog [Babesia bigemina]|eukprot:XP_012769921.1 -Protein C20orf11 homolog [Babesia bigemina]
MAGSSSMSAHYQSSSDEGTAQEPIHSAYRHFRYVRDRESWLADLVDIHVDDVYLQKIVMNYLVVNMCEESYSRFIEETGYTGPDLSHTIASRRRIRDAILECRARDALDLINGVDPKILQKNVHILFNLLSCDLIDIIKTGDSKKAVEYARRMLAPCVQKDRSLIEKLEEILGLIAFGNMEDVDPLDLKHKIYRPEDTAKLVDIALMKHFRQDTRIMLVSLAKEAAWLQGKLSDQEVWKHIRYRDLGRAGIAFTHDVNKL